MNLRAVHRVDSQSTASLHAAQELGTVLVKLALTVRTSANIAVCTWTQRLADILVHGLKLWVDHYVAKLRMCGASTTAPCQRLNRTLESILSRPVAPEAVRKYLRITRILRTTGKENTTRHENGSSSSSLLSFNFAI